MNTGLSETRVLEIATEFLRKHLGHKPPAVLIVRHRSFAELRERAEQIRQILSESGITDHQIVALEVARAACNRQHWVVVFKDPDPPGTASTLHGTVVLVFDDTGEAMLAE